MKKILKNRRLYIPAFVALSMITLASFGETIYLKNNKIIDAPIIESNNEYIVTNIDGVLIKYYQDEIQKIEDNKIWSEEISLDTLIEKVQAKPKSPKEIFAVNSPAVVYISHKAKFGKTFFGTGFIVDPQGFIITNHHVVFPKDFYKKKVENITVTLKNGKNYPIEKLVYYDEVFDLCILKIDAQNLPVVEFSNSQDLEIGETVFTIGNPLGFDYTFSDGLLSSVRTDNGISWIQFTAPVSPGNSGGPLFNTKGQVIGVITMQMTEG